MIDYDLQQDIHIAQVYENFINCLKGNARDTWIVIFRENKDQKTFVTWKKHLKQFIKATLPKEPARKQIKYLKNTSKPRKLNVRKWIRRIKIIYSSLPMMGGEKLKEEELMKEVIVNAWMKPFQLSGAHQCDNVKKVLSTLETLENDEQTYSHKHCQKNKNKASTNTNEKNKRKNMCRHHCHPNTKHKWKNCIYNPKSKNYCGHKGKDDKKQQEENHQTSHKQSTTRSSKNKYQSHRDLSSLSENSDTNSNMSYKRAIT